MIKLKNKYVVGCHIMFYEIEMVEEYLQSFANMLETVENKENVFLDLCFNMSQYMEDMSDDVDVIHFRNRFRELRNDVGRIAFGNSDNYTTRNQWMVNNFTWTEKTDEDELYNNPSYRRDLNYNWCDKVDFVLWGETDSLWPKETFQSIESVSEYANQQNINRYILTFAYRKMWDDGWKPLEHVDMTDLPFVGGEEWNLNAPESPKSYMTLETMNEINSKADQLDIRIINYPKFDGSCLVISSQLIKAGVNIPHAMLMCGEDTSLGDMAKLIMGDKYTQFIVKNILRVHNRRHPNKRVHIKDEDNRMGFCGDAKGNWWKIIESMSKTNLAKLKDNQEKLYTYDDFLKEIGK